MFCVCVFFWTRRPSTYSKLWHFVQTNVIGDGSNDDGGLAHAALFFHFSVLIWKHQDYMLIIHTLPHCTRKRSSHTPRRDTMWCDNVSSVKVYSWFHAWINPISAYETIHHWIHNRHHRQTSTRLNEEKEEEEEQINSVLLPNEPATLVDGWSCSWTDGARWSCWTWLRCVWPRIDRATCDTCEKRQLLRHCAGGLHWRRDLVYVGKKAIVCSPWPKGASRHPGCAEPFVVPCGRSCG